MARFRSPAVIASAAAIVIWIGLLYCYFRNPFHSRSREPVARILGVQSFINHSRSMEPTLHDHQIFWVNSRVLASRDPRVGEVIVFLYPPNPKIVYVKRVVAAGGSTVEMRAGVIFLDGKPLAEPYLPAPLPVVDRKDDFGPIEVPAGSFFVLGDNRGNSEDSRVWGTVPRENVIGVYNP